MGWASGFSAGTNLGKTLVGTYNQASQEDELRKIAEAKPAESTGYTAADGRELEAIANAKDADGKPFYTVTAGPDGAYQVTPNFQTEGKAATPVPVSMRQVTDFLGKRHDGTLDDGQIQKVRTMEMARVIAPRDPGAAMQMQNAIKQGERDDQRFKTETLNAERSGKMADLQLGAAQEAEKTRIAINDFAKGLADGGWGAVPQLYAQYNDGKSFAVAEDGKGGATVTQMDANGKAIGSKQYGNKLEFMQDALLNFDPKLWMSTQQHRQEADTKNQLENRKLDITNNYYQGMLGIHARREDGKEAGLENKMSEPDKVQFTAIGSEVKAINDALIKAQADGLMDPTKPSAGVMALMDRKAALSIQQRQIMERYQAADPQTDKLGVRKPTQTSSGTVAAPASAPSGEISRRVTKEQQAALDKDIPSILARERDDALQRIAAGDERAKTDLASIEREIARLPKGSVPAGRAPTMTSVATEPAPKPAPAMATMTGTAGDRQLKEVAIKNGYKPVTGRDGKTYFSRVVNGQGENLTEEQLAKRLNVGI